MELTELIPAFAAKLGIEGLAVKDGSCSLQIDGIAMELVETTDGKNLVVSAIIGQPPLIVRRFALPLQGAHSPAISMA